jgi:hypothetical protein
MIALLVAGCASAADDRERAGSMPGAQSSLPPALATAEPAAPGRVLAKLRFRDVDLVITGAHAGPRFAVVDRRGIPLATNLEEADLRKRHPELYSAYRYGLAQGAFLDARLDLPREKHRSPNGF